MTGTYGHWIDTDNFVIPADEYPIPPHLAWEHLQPGQAVWFEFVEKFDAFVDRIVSDPSVPSMKMDLRYEFKLGGPPLLGNTAGSFFRVFRLWEGPPRKLSDWRQLPAGRSMLLSLDGSDEIEDLAIFRQRYLARQGHGPFALETRRDGSLWVTKSG